MQTSENIVQQVRLDSNLRVRVRPTQLRPEPYYVFIYRDATGVAWDEINGEFYVRENPEPNPVDDFGRIAAALKREYGEQLILSPTTSFVEIPSDMISVLRNSTTS
jgi:hypothetical protein